MVRVIFSQLVNLDFLRASLVVVLVFMVVGGGVMVFMGILVASCVGELVMVGLVTVFSLGELVLVNFF